MAEGQLPPQPLLTVTGPLTAGFSQSSLQNILDGSANTVSQLALKVIQYIQGVLAEAVNTGQQLAVKVATPIAAGINQAQDTINQIGTQVASSITAATNVATGSCASGCDASGGAKYNEYQYNILQDFDVPASIFVENRDYPLNRGNMNLCFRGGWDSFYDAIAFKAKIQGTPPPPGCGKPGGPAAPPNTGPVLPPNVPPCPTAPWQVWIIVDPKTQQPVGCTVTCVGDPQPPNTIPNGNPISDPVILAQVLAGSSCKPGVTGGGWYAGCENNAPGTWQGTPPSDATQVTGPYPDQATAQSVAATLNCASGPINPPPPPNCQPVQLCGPVDITLPKCIQFDLCDWQKFEDHLVRALCRFYEECVCKLTNETRWSIADCDGELANVIDPWKGQCVKIATDNDPDTIIEMGQGQISGTDWTGAGNNPDPWG